MPEIDGRKYEVVVGGDVADSNGYYLELWEGADQLLEVFCSDADGAMTFTAYRKELPLAVVEWSIAQGKDRLPPKV